MTEQELEVRLAAKAAGLQVAEYSRGRVMVRPASVEESAALPWRPRQNDSDALALASRLNLQLELSCYGARVKWGNDLELWIEREESDRDRFAHARRAIWKAAIEIGKRME